MTTAKQLERFIGFVSLSSTMTVSVNTNSNQTADLPLQ